MWRAKAGRMQTTPASLRGQQIPVLASSLANRHRDGPERVINVEELLGEEARQLTPEAFVRGIRTLRSQFRQAGWRIDLMVGMNAGGVAIASMMGANEMGANALIAYGAAHLSGAPERHLDHIQATPPPGKTAAECNVLLVDLQMKTAHSLDLVKDALVALGFDEARMRVALLTLAHLYKLPTGGCPFPLSSTFFRPQQAFVPLHYDAWLAKVGFLAYVSVDAPLAPWYVWDKDQP